MEQHVKLITLSFAFGFLFLFDLPVSAQKRPPNIVLIVSDDMGYADIGIHGGKDIDSERQAGLSPPGRPGL